MSVLEKAKMLIEGIETELKAGTVHTQASTGRQLFDKLEILKTMQTNDLLIQFHCQGCGMPIGLFSIKDRYCLKCQPVK